MKIKRFKRAVTQEIQKKLKLKKERAERKKALEEL